MERPVTPATEIRDPIHGAITVDRQETAVIDHPFVQRLRGIRQLGFSHLPFPGATHSRYNHSLGVMHLAGRAFDSCFPDHPFESAESRHNFRHCVRLAAMCHDLGHAPFSHAAEFAMPSLRTLGIRCYDPTKVEHRLDKRASHEDYTIAILTQSTLADTIRENFGFEPEHVARLVSHEVNIDDDFFVHRDFDLRYLLSQLISSDLDSDRLDYLVRDSYYTGARYGQVDVNWLISNMARHVDPQGRVSLAIDRRALYAFDDFMIARFHMFVMVYFHQKSVAYEEMLKRYVLSEACDYRLPAELEAYRQTDDVQMMAHIRRSDDEWARRIVQFNPIKVIWEGHGAQGERELETHHRTLLEGGIDAVAAPGHGVVYGQRKPGMPPIFVVDRHRNPGHVQPVDEATEIFKRYQDERCVGRIYVRPEDKRAAAELLKS
ncbi:MAG: hydrolase [Deltaproteobacteria bacterium]|nr:hydrolase [Deltaproteobacteria bacterium]